MKIKVVRSNLIPATVGIAIAACVILGIGIHVSVSVDQKTSKAEGPGPTPGAFQTLGQADDTTWVKRDSVRGVICYVYYYRDHDHSASAGGISCIPESQLKNAGQ